MSAAGNNSSIGVAAQYMMAAPTHTRMQKMSLWNALGIKSPLVRERLAFFRGPARDSLDGFLGVISLTP